MPPASRCGLNQQGITQELTRALRLAESFDWATAPRYNWHLRLFGQALGTYFVAQPPHRIAIRANEHDSHTAAQIGKFGVLGHESPSCPNCFGMRGLQSVLQSVVMDIAAGKLSRT